VRAEADQFLLSCVELSTFLEWLDALFAAIDVAAPLDERDFPRDQSIPRIQRIQWIRGQTTDPALSFALGMTGDDPDAVAAAAPGSPLEAAPAEDDTGAEHGDGGGEADVTVPTWTTGSRESGATVSPAGTLLGPGPGPSRELASRMSTTSYPNDEIDCLSGKWAPAHHWGPAHDMHYAKLCYSVLLFRSPRKSNYIVNRGKKWYVDWATGRMVRVLPPEYGEIHLFGPWQTVHTENRFL
jgi:hypothetical protein